MSSGPRWWPSPPPRQQLLQALIVCSTLLTAWAVISAENSTYAVPPAEKSNELNTLTLTESKVVTCEKPFIPHYGILLSLSKKPDNEQRYPVGTAGASYCFNGIKAPLTCLANGQWSHSIVNCPTPDKQRGCPDIKLDNGRILLKKPPNVPTDTAKFPYGSKAGLKCNQGFELVPKQLAVLICEQKYRWSSPLPACVALPNTPASLNNDNVGTPAASSSHMTTALFIAISITCGIFIVILVLLVYRKVELKRKRDYWRRYFLRYSTYRTSKNNITGDCGQEMQLYANEPSQSEVPVTDL